MRQLIFGIIIIAMAFTLHNDWLTLAQLIAGAVMTTIGIMRLKRKRYETK